MKVRTKFQLNEIFFIAFLHLLPSIMVKYYLAPDKVGAALIIIDLIVLQQLSKNAQLAGCVERWW